MTWVGMDKLPNGDIAFLADAVASSYGELYHVKKVARIAPGVVFS